MTPTDGVWVSGALFSGAGGSVALGQFSMAVGQWGVVQHMPGSYFMTALLPHCSDSHLVF